MRWADMATGVARARGDRRWHRMFSLYRGDQRSAMAIMEKSIAVLPFENLSEDQRTRSSLMACKTKS